MTSPAERRPRVVVADDHPRVLLALTSMLQLCCEVVASVSNGHEAIEAVTRLKPDILVVDLMMPDIYGVEVCLRVKQNEPETDIVVITAFDDTGVQAIAVQNGASAFVPKHAVTEILERTIQRLFTERQAARESNR